MGTKTGLNGITFGDATVQNTAAVTGVTSAVAGTGVSVSAATGAVTFTNSGVTSLVAGTGVSVSGATGAVTVSATGGGTVTSVATGNGLSGGTITTSGTLVVACPSFNSVGSYAQVYMRVNGNSTVTAGSDYATGTGNLQLQSAQQQDGLVDNEVIASYGTILGSGLSGTWRWMGASRTTPNNVTYGISFAIACRVS